MGEGFMGGGGGKTRRAGQKSIHWKPQGPPLGLPYGKMNTSFPLSFLIYPYKEPLHRKDAHHIHFSDLLTHAPIKPWPHVALWPFYVMDTTIRSLVSDHVFFRMRDGGHDVLLKFSGLLPFLNGPEPRRSIPVLSVLIRQITLQFKYRKFS